MTDTKAITAPVYPMTEHRRITAHFKAEIELQETLEVRIDPAGAGYVTVSPEPVGGVEHNWLFPHGTIVYVTAHPNPGYVFDSWSGEMTDTKAITAPVYPMTEHRRITAHFQAEIELQETLEVRIDPYGAGYVTVSPEPVGGVEHNWLFPHGTIVYVTAHPNPGYVFDSWSGEMTDTKAITAPVYPMTEHRRVTAHFKLEIEPEEYELIQHTIFPYAYIYDGDVEVTTATFKTDPFTPPDWMGDKFASKLEEEVRARGGRPIEVKVYADTTPLLWTNFRVEVTGTPLGGAVEAAPGVSVGIPVWLAIILVCLAIIAVIIVVTLAIKTITEMFKHKPGLEDVKPGWGKETLMGTIHDSEEYWERPLTPLETLEGMSEQELRDHLDQIAEEEVKPEFPWPLVIVGGVCALAAIGLAAYGAAPRRKKE